LAQFSQPFGVQSEDYVTCDSALKVCGIQSVRSIFSRLEEVAQHKATFLDALKELEAARKYVPQVDTDNNIVMCDETETLIEWFKK
jgi:spermidine synthase